MADHSVNVVVRGLLYVVIVGGLILATGWALACIAYGREGDNHGNHGDLKKWFDSLASRKGLCCSFADGFSVKEVDWDTAIGADGKSHYRVKLPAFNTIEYGTGQEVRVPPSEGYVEVPDGAVITEPNLYGDAVVWPYADNQGNPQIRCFMPGAGT